MYLGEKPTLTRPLIGQKLVAFLAAALEASHRISTHVIAAAVVEAALVDIFKQRPKHTLSTHTGMHEHSKFKRNIKE